MQRDDLATRIDAVRRFNRFFTRRIGVLREGLLHTPYSLTEARILFEISHRDDLTASDLSRELGLDPGYLSRTLARLEQQGLVVRVRSEADGRRRILSLTLDGEEAFSLLDSRSREEVAEMLGGLSEGEQRRLLEAMGAIEGVFEKSLKFSEPFVLRTHEPGDMGWVVQRHGVLYAREYGWDESFEALVARIVADFIDGYDPKKERCWIGEMGGERVGCVFVVKASDAVAKLRLLLVEPEARGLGLGTRLVEDGARHIYEEHGFVLVEEEEHHSFGRDLVGQNWDLVL
jgi:DNA-binding MarR family transcriptional regulator/GNAT superfamily N-acetyltransferase